MQMVRIGGGFAQQHSSDSVGTKAANLARMNALGLPVPPAFVLPIELCAAILNGKLHARQELSNGLNKGIEFLEKATGKRFGDRRDPLLVSVRSGAARSMPGMLDTVLNVGCTLSSVHGLVRKTGNPHFAWDCRRRFLENYGTVVLGLGSEPFESLCLEMMAGEGVENEQMLDCEALERLAQKYQDLIEEGDQVVSENAMEQLETAALAVLHSWTTDRASSYRRLQHLEDLKGTSVTVQTMVFGNLGMSSGAGVAFSRDPSTGALEQVIDFLFEAQGEDVVSGRRTPEPEFAMERSLAVVGGELRGMLALLEREFRDVQDVEFTIENGKLWILQSRSAKRTVLAALRFASDFVKEKLITPSEALQRLDGLDLSTASSQRLVGARDPLAQGVGASAGVAVGRAAFDPAGAERMAESGEPVIFLRSDTRTADVESFALSAGIVTAAGGRTAHAALVARQLAKPCIVGCSALDIDASKHNARLSGFVINEGDWLSIDGEAGTIYPGRLQIVSAQLEAELAQVNVWRERGTL
jgi:pyruvate, orthophosphate dikinase